MARLRFDDGMEFEVGGPLRVVHRHDGWYVVGEGYLVACSSREEGKEIVRDLGGRGDTERKTP